MLWLILSVICSSLIFVVFKLFEKYQISNLPAIVINYFIAFAVGLAGGEFEFSATGVVQESWFFSTVILGLLFITLFRLMAVVSQKWGVSAVSVAVKMSLVVPVIFTIIRYDESVGFLKIAGIIAALASVYLATYKPEKVERDPKLAFLPLLLFAGSGFLDAFLAYNQNELVPDRQSAYFSSMIFGMAGLIGVAWFLVEYFRGFEKFKLNALWGGIALGIPNYGSIYFLLRALGSSRLENSIIFPINNVGIVFLSVILGITLFTEKLSRTNLLGIILAVVAIVFMTIANYTG